MPGSLYLPDHERRQRSARARAAALRRHALHPDGTKMGPARAAVRAKFERAVDPDAILSPDELAVRADRLFRSWAAAIAAQAGRKRAGQPWRRLNLDAWLAGTKSEAVMPGQATAPQKESERDSRSAARS